MTRSRRGWPCAMARRSRLAHRRFSIPTPRPVLPAVPYTPPRRPTWPRLPRAAAPRTSPRPSRTRAPTVEFADGCTADRPGVNDDLTRLEVMGGTFATNSSSNFPVESLTFDTQSGVWNARGSAQSTGALPVTFSVNEEIRTDADL